MNKSESQAMDLGKDNITRLFFKLFFPTPVSYTHLTLPTIA